MILPRVASGQARTGNGAWLLFLLAALVSFPAFAAEPRVPSVEEIVNRLKAPPIGPDDLRSRAVTVEDRPARAAAAQSIDLDINFEYGSAKLTPDARLILDNLAYALSDPALRDARILVTGHTDARGNRAYNLRLSRERAASVAAYLVRIHRLPAARLSVDGKGFSELRDPEHPESPVNRRVQITNAGP
jgi:outer membrane protein OmpA-like peptidoglycan-associated protein